MWYLICLFACLAGFVVSLALGPAFIRLAIARGIVDHPSGRKVHQRPTPLLGGAPMIVSFLLTLTLAVSGALALARFAPSLPGLEPLTRHLPGFFSALPGLVLIAAGGVMVFLFGLVDDTRGLSAGWKLAGQGAIALALFLSGLRVTLFIGSTAVSLVLTMGWVLFITNSFNLMDNMDGLAASTAVIAGFLFFLYALESGALFIAALLAVFIGSVLGFLRYNLPPARVFMGEAGSTFLGYFLAVIAVQATFYYERAPSYLPVLAPLFILAVPIYDTVSVVLIRLHGKRSIFTAGKDHFSHRLVGFGLTRRRALGVICLLTLGLGLPALILAELPFWAGFLLLLQAAIFLGVISLLNPRHEE